MKMKNLANQAMSRKLNEFDFHILSQYGEIMGYVLEENNEEVASYKVIIGNGEYVRYKKTNKAGFVLNPETDEQ